MQTAQDSILERIRISRGTSDPAPVETTEVTEVVNVSEDAPIENVIEPEAQVNEAAKILRASRQSLRTKSLNLTISF